MRKNKALTVIAAAVFATSAKIAFADTNLFTSFGDFAGSGEVINAEGTGYVGGDINTAYSGIGPVPTAASLAAGQEVGYEGLGVLGSAETGDILHNNSSATGSSTDSKGDPLIYVHSSLGNAAPVTNGVGHYANDFGATTDQFGDGYPTTPNAGSGALPTVAAPFNAGGTDPYLGRSYAGVTGTAGAMVVQNYQPFNNGLGNGTVQITTGEMIVPNTTFPGAVTAAPTGNSAATTKFINTIANSYAMAFDFTAPGGGTTLTLNGTGTAGYFILGFATSDSSVTTPTTKAGGFNTSQYDWVNPSTSLANKDVGSQGDQPGSFVVQHGSGASSYWTAYLPYSYAAAAQATFFQLDLQLNMDHYLGGNVTIDNIRTISPQWAASGSGLSWTTGGSLTPDTNEIQGTNGSTITANVNSEEEILAGASSTSAGNWIGAQSSYIPTTFTGVDADMNGVTQQYGLGVPSGSGTSITFGDLETGNASVGLDANQTVGTLIFNSTGDNSSAAPIQYNLTASSTVAGVGVGAGGTLILDNTINSASAAINFIAGSPTEFITAQVQLNSNTVVTVSNAADTLFFGSAANANTVVVGGISGVGSMEVAGPGTVQFAFANTYTGGTTVDAGATLTASADNGLPSGHALVNNGTTNIQGSASLSSLTGTGTLHISPGSDATSVVQLATNSGLATEGGLTIAANSVLDITNNHMVIGYAPGTQATFDSTIRGLLISGYNGGAFTGTTGITSSTAAANPGFAVGYADGADGVVAGLSSGQLELKYTRYGDANLDGVVSGVDFTILVGNLGKSVSAWDKGDFNYDGVVSGVDFTLLVGNLGKSANGADITLPAADLAAIDAFAAANGLMSSVPEPTTAGLLLVAGVGMLARRRRNDSRQA